MKIVELLVRDGYWPTTLGPCSSRQMVIKDKGRTTIKLSPGTFSLDAPIKMTDGMVLVGSSVKNASIRDIAFKGGE